MAIQSSLHVGTCLLRSDGLTLTLGTMSNQCNTVDRSGCSSPFLRIAVAIAVLLIGGCGQEDQAMPPLTKPEETVRETVKFTAPISESAFREAALQGQIETVREAIDQGVEVNATDIEGRTALHFASFNGHTDIVLSLLAKGAVVDRRDKMGRTALMFAASGSNQETVSALLKAKADPNIVDSGEGFTALMHAAAEGQLEVVKILLSQGADATIRDVDGDTALNFASRNGHSDVVQLFSQ